MKIIKVDNKHYIRLGDLDHLLRQKRMEILDKYNRDENGAFIQEDGTKGLTAEDSIKFATLIGIRSDVVVNLVHACETPDEIRELNRRIENEFYMDKYAITAHTKDEEGKEMIVYFRKFCKGATEAKLREEGKTPEEIEKELEDAVGEPAFSAQSRDAYFFENHEDADGAATYINSNYGVGAEVKPAWYLNHKAVKRFLDTVLNSDEKEDTDEQV